jgi:hypothetical protein
MPEEPGADAPGPGRAEPAPERPPRWARRKALVVGLAIGITVAAAIAVGATTAARPVPQRLAYTRLAPACELVSAAHLVKYLPGATGKPTNVPAEGAQDDAACSWSSGAAMMGVRTYLYDSSDGLTQAQQTYRRSVPAPCTCKDYTLSTQYVAHLGNQATAVFTRAPIGPSGSALMATTVDVLVRSGNVIISVYYYVTPLIGGPTLQPTSAALLAATITMVRDALAGLARPAALTAVPLTVPSPVPGPLYAGLPHPCTLLRPRTLARYVPGATAQQLGYGFNVGDCSWIGRRVQVTLDVDVLPDYGTAERYYRTAVQQDKVPPAGTTFTGSEPVKGLGQQATADFQAEPLDVTLLSLQVWSRNADIDLTVDDLLYGPALSRAAKVALATTLVRAVLADLPIKKS